LGGRIASRTAAGWVVPTCAGVGGAVDGFSVAACFFLHAEVHAASTTTPAQPVQRIAILQESLSVSALPGAASALLSVGSETPP
jgi:hypothetical protein